VADAIMVGRGTLEADTMSMLVPEELRKGRPAPARVVVSRSGSWDLAHPLFKHDTPIYLCTIGGVPSTTVDLPQVTELHADNLGKLLELLSQQGVQHIHCEGGGELIHALGEIDAIDTLHLTVAGHSAFSGSQAPTLTGVLSDYLPASRHFSLSHFEPTMNGECFLTYQRL